MEERNLITVVCTGNICRSPMAAALLSHALAAEDEPLRSLQVVSAGVSAYNGEPASEYAQRALQRVGLDLSHHRSRRLTAEVLERSMLVLAMTEGHRSLIRHVFGDLEAPVLLFRELMGEADERQVPDPYGADLGYYMDTRDSIAEAVPAIIAYLKERLARPSPDHQPR